MFLPLAKFGSIEDLGLNLRWDALTLAGEVERRAGVLSQMKIGRGSIVAIAHPGSVHFFGDLFAVWATGATAACLDGSLTETEVEAILDFAKPAALLVAGVRTESRLSVPVLELGRASPAAPLANSGFELDDPALILFTSGTTGALVSPRALQLTAWTFRIFDS